MLAFGDEFIVPEHVNYLWDYAHIAHATCI